MHAMSNAYMHANRTACMHACKQDCMHALFRRVVRRTNLGEKLTKEQMGTFSENLALKCPLSVNSILLLSIFCIQLLDRFFLRKKSDLSINFLLV